VSIEVLNESGVDVDGQGLVALARHVLGELGVHPLAELSVLLVDEAAMTQLHLRWMGEDGPTDVLAFPMDELEARGQRGAGSGSAATWAEESGPLPQLLGDVVLCPQVAARQAREAGHAATDELHLLCTHGVLHLLGYDHGEPDEAQEMFGLQGSLLTGWRRHLRSSAGVAGSS